MKCDHCRRHEYKETTWDRTRLWLFRRFRRDIEDLRQDFYTRGITEGIKLGFQQAKDQEQRYQEQLKAYYAQKPKKSDQMLSAEDFT